VAIPALAGARHPAIALAGLPEPARGEVAACLAARGLPRARACEPAELAAVIGDGGVAGVWLEPTADLAAALAPGCHAAAAAGRPLVVLARPARGKPVELAAALAFLRSHGALVCGDPDAWLEALCLIAWHGLPHGPRAAVVAAAGSWLAIAAAGLAADELDGRRPQLAADAAELAPADVALIAEWAELPPRPSTSTMLVPLCARGERLAEAPTGALVGLRPALAAIAAAGKAAERIRAGLGPAVRAGRDLDVDEERLERQLAKLTPGETRLGDHEAKVLLAAYGVAITRQAVATTASAALRIARKAGFPVDLKRWGAEVPLERDGAVVEAGVATAADVRRAYAAVLGHDDDGAVIVRESPPAGREVAASIAPLGALGWTVVLEGAGLVPVAAPAPLRAADAAALAQVLVASRAGDDEPDRAGLAALLRRASHLAVDLGDRLARLDLARIVVGGRGGRTLVVDAAAELRLSRAR
jgi:hypothetical protein